MYWELNHTLDVGNEGKLDRGLGGILLNNPSPGRTFNTPKYHDITL